MLTVLAKERVKELTLIAKEDPGEARGRIALRVAVRHLDSHATPAGPIDPSAEPPVDYRESCRKLPKAEKATPSASSYVCPADFPRPHF